MRKERQFVVNERGEKVAVVLSIEEYEEILEELEDREAIREYEEAKASGERPFPSTKQSRGLNAIGSELRSPHPATG